MINCAKKIATYQILLFGFMFLGTSIASAEESMWLRQIGPAYVGKLMWFAGDGHNQGYANLIYEKKQNSPLTWSYVYPNRTPLAPWIAIETDESSRVVIWTWKSTSTPGRYYHARMQFSEDFNSFVGTWGVGESQTDGGKMEGEVTVAGTAEGSLERGHCSSPETDRRGTHTHNVLKVYCDERAGKLFATDNEVREHQEQKKRLATDQEQITHLFARVRELDQAFKAQGLEILGQVRDDFSNVGQLQSEIQAIEEAYAAQLASAQEAADDLKQKQSAVSELQERISNLEDKFREQGRAILSTLKEDHSNLDLVDIKMEILESDNFEYVSSLADLKKRYDELLTTARSLEKGSRITAVEALSKITSDYSNIDEIAQEIELLEIASNNQKKFTALRDQVKELDGDFKTQANRLLVEIAEDFSNFEQISLKINEIIDQHADLSKKIAAGESVRAQVAEFEGDLKTQGESILATLESDFSNLDAILTEIEELSHQHQLYLDRKETHKELTRVVSRFEDKYKPEGEDALSRLNSDLSNLDSVVDEIEELRKENYAYWAQAQLLKEVKAMIAEFPESLKPDAESLLTTLDDDLSNVEDIHTAVVNMEVEFKEKMADNLGTKILNYSTWADKVRPVEKSGWQVIDEKQCIYTRTAKSLNYSTGQFDTNYLYLYLNKVIPKAISFDMEWDENDGCWVNHIKLPGDSVVGILKDAKGNVVDERREVIVKDETYGCKVDIERLMEAWANMYPKTCKGSKSDF